MHLVYPQPRALAQGGAVERAVLYVRASADAHDAQQHLRTWCCPATTKTMHGAQAEAVGERGRSGEGKGGGGAGAAGRELDGPRWTCTSPKEGEPMMYTG